MKITKLTDELVYKKEAYTYTLEVNGKKVRVHTYQVEDNEMSDCNYDSDQEINEVDLKALTDEEYEVIGENLTELLALKEGESTDITYDK